MTRLKKMIAIVVSILIVLLIILLVHIRTSNKEFEEEFGDKEILDKGNQPVSYSKSLEQVKDSTMFYTVSTCVQKYLNYAYVEKYEDMTQEDYKIEENNSLIAMYNMLSKDYIDKYSITENNVSNYVHSSEYPLMFYPANMNYIDGNKTQVYSVYGYIENSNNNKYIQDVFFIVYLDRSNMTFSIDIPEANSIHNINDIQLINNEDTIEKNSYNLFEYNRIDDEELVEKYFNNYTRCSTKYPEKAYNLLDEEYRNAKFGSLEAYNKYVKNNVKEIITTTLEKYQITKKDGYTQYTCIDTNGNYYIFRETATMQYTLMLDTYTIDIPEFTQKYNTADEMTKVGMNIEKINTALNAKDYKYIYSKLPDSFKNNYFNTLESLEGYMENTFYDKNTITYSEFSNEGKNYMFKIEVKDANNTSNSAITKTIIMQLKEGTDFVFSFNV